MVQVASVTVDVSLELGKLQADFAKLEAKLASVQDVKLQADGAVAFAIAATYVDQLSSSLANLQNAALSASTAFDSAKAAVATLSNEPGKIADDMKGLAGELNNQVSSTALLKSSYDVLSSGFTNAADQSKILKASVLGATGGFSDVGTVSDGVTTILNAYGKSADEAGKITDQLIATQNAGKITVAEYGALIGSAASTAAAAGVSFEEFSAFVATATIKGVKAGSAVAGLKQAMSAILKPSQEASEKAASLGVEFNATALKTKGLAGILKELNDKGAATPQVLTKLFGSVEAVAAITPAAADGFKVFNASLETVAKSAGMAQSASDKVANSFQGQLTAAANAANESMVALGDGVRAVLTPILALGAVGLKVFNSLPDPVKQLAGAGLAVTAALAGVVSISLAVSAALPALAVGYAALNVQLRINEALAIASVIGAKAQVIATTAMAIASQLAAGASASLNIGMITNTAATVANTASKIANAVATRAAAAAQFVLSGGIQQGIASVASFAASQNGLITQTLQTAATLGKLAVTAALAYAAFEVGKDIFNTFKTDEFSAQLNKSTEEFNNFTGTLSKTSSRNDVELFFDNLGESLNRFQEIASKRGVIEGLRDSLVQLQDAATGADNANDAYGASFGFVTQQQLQNQQQQIAVGKAFEATSGTLEKGQSVLSKYGLLQKDASDATRLGKDGIANFNKAATEQVSVIDANIKALSAQKSQNPEIQQQINNQVALLERQKAAILDRIAFLEKESAAADKNAASQNNLASAYKKALANIANAQDIDQLNLGVKRAEDFSDIEINDSKLANKQTTKTGGLTSEDGKINESLIDKESSKRALDIKKAELEQLNKLKQDGKISVDEFATKELEITKSVSSEKIKLFEAEEKVKLAQLAKIEAASKKSDDVSKLEKSKSSLAAREQLKAGKAPTEGLEAVENKLERASTNQRIASKTTELAELKKLRDAGVITAQEYANKERAINQSITDDKLKLFDLELKAKLRQIEQESAIKKSALDIQAQTLTGVENVGLKQQTVELAAQSDLNKAITEQTELRIQASNQVLERTALIAQRQGDFVTQSEALAQQEQNSVELFKAKEQSLTQQQAIETETLKLTNEQNLNNAKAASLQAQINVLVAEEAILKAQAEGKSAKEIGILQRRLALSQKISEATANGVKSQQKVNDSSEKALAVRQDNAKEKLALDKQNAINSFEDKKFALETARITTQYETVKKTAENAIKGLDALKQQLDSRNNLNKSVNELAVTGGDIRARNAGNALNARKEIANADTPDNVKKTLANQIQNSGFAVSGNDEQDIAALAKAKFDAEQNLINLKRNALIAEQASQRLMLEIDIKRQEIAAKTAVIEAKKALALAKQKGNTEEIASAQELGKLANEQSANVGQYGAEQRGALAAQQQNARAQFDQNANEQTNAAEVERARNDPNYVGGNTPSRLPDTSTPAIATQAQASGSTQNAVNNSDALLLAFNAKFDKLSDAIEKLADKATEPRSVTINGSKDPVSDGARFYKEQSKQRARSAGI